MKIFRVIVFVVVIFISATLPKEAYGQRKIVVSTLTVSSNGEIFYAHTLKRREKLKDIAKAYEVTVKEIVEANPKLRSGIKVGTTILIPLPQLPEGEANGAEIKEDGSPTTDSHQEDGTMLGGMQGHEGFVGDTIDSLSAPPVVEFGLTAPFDPSDEITVAMLLPFDSVQSSASMFVNFYRGALLAIDEVVDQGAVIELVVISTDRTVERAEQIVQSGELDGAEIIVGPIYPEEFDVVAQYAASRRIPIVSPLAKVDSTDNAFVVEFAPSRATMWDKYKEVLQDTAVNIIVVKHSTLADSLHLQEIMEYVPITAAEIEYENKLTEIEVLTDRLSADIKNIIVVPISNETAAEEVIARYNSFNVEGLYDIEVVGMPSWARFSRVDLDIFFRLSVNFPTTYFFDRMSPETAEVYASYVKRYAELPTLYTMRGYDVMKIVVGLAYDYGDEIMYELIRDTPAPLEVPYLFEQDTDNGKLYNVDWPIVHYNRDYTIVVE